MVSETVSICFSNLKNVRNFHECTWSLFNHCFVLQLVFDTQKTTESEVQIVWHSPGQLCNFKNCFGPIKSNNATLKAMKNEIPFCLSPWPLQALSHILYKIPFNLWIKLMIWCFSDRASWYRPGVGNLLVVLCPSNVAKSLSVPTHPSPPYFYIQQPMKHVNLILSKLSFWRDVKTGIALKELYASI